MPKAVEEIGGGLASGFGAVGGMGAAPTTVTCLFGEGGLNLISLDYASLCAGEAGPLGRKVIEQ